MIFCFKNWNRGLFRGHFEFRRPLATSSRIFFPRPWILCAQAIWRVFCRFVARTQFWYVKLWISLPDVSILILVLWAISYSEMKDIYKPLKYRPSCDFILPDDWFYMPLLEIYFHHARPPTNESDHSKAYFKVDPEVTSDFYIISPRHNTLSLFNISFNSRLICWTPLPVWVGFGVSWIYSLTCCVKTLSPVESLLEVIFPESVVRFWPARVLEPCASMLLELLWQSWFPFWFLESI